MKLQGVKNLFCMATRVLMVFLAYKVGESGMSNAWMKILSFGCVYLLGEIADWLYFNIGE